ncbi:MAG TPA: C1 family peptidase [Candidatus Acidoferrales bacterium]|nr:C1 family peptidase [Candidatus Acidoferrales bacterium]
MFRRILVLSLVSLGCAAAQGPNAVPAVVFGPQAVVAPSGRPAPVDFQFGLVPLVHGPYSLIVLNPDRATGTMSLNGTPVFQNNLSGLFESQPVTLESANTLSVELNGGTIWVAVYGWEYAFASDYKAIPSGSATPSGSALAYPNGSLNWVVKGAVTPIKNQGALCPASWAFSTTGAIESAIAIKHGQLTSLSEQEFIDCSAARSCLFGSTPLAMTWAVNNGDDTEAVYPYTGTGKRACNASIPAAANTKITGFSRGPIGDENVLGTLVDIGPVSVVINGNWFARYTGGVANPQCESQIPSFWSVLIVGYGHDSSTGLDYWLVKNSLGPNWGELGYFRIVRNQNKCGIADYTLRVED